MLRSLKAPLGGRAFVYLSSESVVKSATSARTKRKPRRARFESNAAIPSEHTFRRAVAMQVLKKFRQAFRLAKSHSSSLRKRKRVSSAEMGTLRELGEHPGMRVTELAEALALHQSTISNLIGKLLHRQLVRRKRDNMDSRVVHLYLTTAGERVVIISPAAPHNVLLDTLEHLSAKTLRLLDSELAGLLDRPAQARMRTNK